MTCIFESHAAVSNNNNLTYFRVGAFAGNWGNFNLQHLDLHVKERSFLSVGSWKRDTVLACTEARGSGRSKHLGGNLGYRYALERERSLIALFPIEKPTPLNAMLFWLQVRDALEPLCWLGARYVGTASRNTCTFWRGKLRERA